MRRPWLIGVGLFVLAAFTQWPAAWVAPWIAQVTHERWRLGAVQGTLWHGRATLYSLDRPSQRWRAGRGLGWNFAWSELARGRLAVQVDLDDGGKARLTAGIRGWAIGPLEAVMSADQVTALLPGALGEYGWSGRMRAMTDQFQCLWVGSQCAGRIELTWENAAVAQISGPTLGDYRLRLTAEGQALRFDLATMRGRLQITGSGELSAGSLRFRGEAEAAGENAGNLDTILRAIGRPGAVRGRYMIEYREALN